MATTPPTMTACDQLALLRAQMQLLMSGKAVLAIDTPQLGRVEYSKGSIPDLQMEIDRLTALCNAEQGLTDGPVRRRPISLEAWP